MVSRKKVTKAQLLKAKAKIQRQGSKGGKKYYKRKAKSYGDNPRKRSGSQINLREIWEVNYALKKAKGKRPAFPYSIMLFVNGYEKQATASKDAKFLKNYVARRFEDLDVKVVKGKVKRKK